MDGFASSDRDAPPHKNDEIALIFVCFFGAGKYIPEASTMNYLMIGII